MHIFDDERKYASWLVRNDPGGYVLHRAGRTFTLHKAGCDHVEVGYGDDITRNPKYCSETKSELTRYAIDQTGAAPKSCRSCGS